ncbi:MAG: PAS domain S-box protein [Candidatus Nanopelagicales bacterium]
MMDPQVLVEAVRDPDGLVVDLVFRSVNRAACSFIGALERDLLDRGVVSTFPNVPVSGLMGQVAGCLDGTPVILEDFPYFSDVTKKHRRYDMRATQAGADLIVFTWRDVTERLDIIQRIAASERNYRLLAENTADVTVHVRDDRFLWVSPSIERLLGAPPEYWLGRDVREIIPQSGLADWAARAEVVASGGVVRQRYQVLSVDGVLHWVASHLKPFYDDGGSQIGSLATLRLVDGEVIAEQELEKARKLQAKADERYRKSMDNSAVAMCLIGLDGGFVEVNDALCQLSGFAAETLMQKTFREFIAPEYFEASLEKALDMMGGRFDSYRMLKQYVHAEGRRLWGDLSMSCIRDEHGDVEYFIAQITDITALVEANELNRELAQRLQRKTDQVTEELESAASYIASILPSGLAGEPSVSSRYVPASELGGDSFDYRWLDDDHLFVYLLDVSGHGVPPALLSASLHNMLRFGNLAPADLLAPDTVLTELNRRFQMDQHGYHYFTMWCGVYEVSSRTLRYSSAGAPPALAFNSVAGTTVAVTELSTNSPPVGIFENTVFGMLTYVVPTGCQILIHSDGASEISLTDGRQMTPMGFKTVSTRVASAPDWSLDDLVDELSGLTPQGAFEDDCSLIQVRFD